VNRTLGDVIQEAAKGGFALTTLRVLGASDAGKVEAAVRELEHMALAWWKCAQLRERRGRNT
jgi:hypothetical protein